MTLLLLVLIPLALLGLILGGLLSAADAALLGTSRAGLERADHVGEEIVAHIDHVVRGDAARQREGLVEDARIGFVAAGLARRKREVEEFGWVEHRWVFRRTPCHVSEARGCRGVHWPRQRQSR